MLMAKILAELSGFGKIFHFFLNNKNKILKKILIEKKLRDPCQKFSNGFHFTNPAPLEKYG